MTSFSLAHAVDLYPLVPTGANPDLVLRLLPPLLEGKDVTALRLCLDMAPFPPFLDALLKLAHHHNVALIAAPASGEKTASLISRLPLDQLDGVHLADLNGFSALPRREGRKSDFQVGCACATLDDAMIAGEKGADYVSFPAAQIDLFEQWTPMTELPSVAELSDETEGTDALPHHESDASTDISTSAGRLAARAASAGADFIALPLRLDGEDSARLNDIRAALAAARA